MAVSMQKATNGCIHQAPSEKNEVSKSIGKQLNVSFSKYNQWQRKERLTRPPVSNEREIETKMTFKVGKLHRTAVVNFAPVSISRSRRTLAKLEEEKRKHQEIIDTLKLNIKHIKQTTDMYNKRCKELDMETQEHETYAEVKRLLRKYEKFRGSIATLNSHFAREISEVRSELQETERIIQKKLKTLELQVEEKDKELKNRQEEIHVLLNYKDKEYPVKAMAIAKLQAELESIKNSSQEDLEELEHIIMTELDKYNKARITFANNVNLSVAEECVSLMHPSLQDMALQNIMMKKEIEFHKTKQKNLIQSNKELQEEVAVLLQHPKSNLRLQLFPEVFAVREKCKPEIELVLDIPKQEWLPL